MRKYGARMFVASCSSNPATCHSASGACWHMAALLTSPSTRPNAASAASMIRAGLAGSARSAGTATAAPPAPSIAPAHSRSSSGRRPTSTTDAPAAPSSRAAAAPIPLPAPVTTTAEPSQAKVDDVPGGGGCAA